jgi:alpha/beta superfamily hydrolase
VNKPDERACWIDGGEWRLEGLLAEGDGALSALVLHPHPQYGGDMHNHVVVGLTDALRSLGMTTLRFNFRGVGRSQGAFDGGAGEAADAVAALDYLNARAGGRPILLAGYSFGAMIAAAVAADHAPEAVLLVSPPLGFSALPAITANVPALVVVGDRDPLAPAESARALALGATSVLVVPGADHGWWPGLDELTAAASKFAAQAIARRSDA